MPSDPWDQRYAADEFAFGKEPNDWLVEQGPRLKARGGQVLSLAEGEGRNAAYLAQLGLSVTAMDRSAVGLAKAQRLAAERGVLFSTRQGDLADFDLGIERWDGIVSVWCHVPSRLRRDLHARVVKALKPGGWFVLEAYTPGQIALGTGGPKDPDFLATEDQLKEELTGLEWHITATLRRQVHEGARHAGPSEVVRLVGRKPGLEAEDRYLSFRCDCV